KTLCRSRYPAFASVLLSALHVLNCESDEAIDAIRRHLMRWKNRKVGYDTRTDYFRAAGLHRRTVPEKLGRDGEPCRALSACRSAAARRRGPRGCPPPPGRCAG